MNKIDLIKLALKNFMRRKTRSILTILGVVIGTAAIVVMISLGIGMNESYRQSLKSMGSLNVIDVNPYYVPENATGMVTVKESKLDDAAIAKIAAIDGVVAVTPYLSANLKIVSGKYSLQANIVGIDPDAMAAFDFKVGSGRLLAKDDTSALVFGCQTPYSFMNPKNNGRGGGMMFFSYGRNNSEVKKPDPLVNVLVDKMIMTFDWSYGERKSVGMFTDPTVRTKPPKLYKAQGVGILEESQDYDKAYTVYMNIDYLKKITKEYNKSQNVGGTRGNRQQTDSYQQVKVKVENIDIVQKIQKEINNMGYGTNSLGDILKNLQKQSATMQAVLGGIGAISLLVAALGITNTMIMSIYERTREIGVMKVLGCLLSDIRNMFLFEAGVIGFTGGIAGLLFSYGASFVLNKFAGGLFGGGGAPGENTISIIPVWLALAALGFATLVGLISGFMPARRAMKLSALEAIKTE
jgi:ABC-type antimicrobial peptide transport system permease subunit